MIVEPGPIDELGPIDEPAQLKNLDMGQECAVSPADIQAGVLQRLLCVGDVGMAQARGDARTERAF